jgi:hypothetical protein
VGGGLSGVCCAIMAARKGAMMVPSWMKRIAWKPMPKANGNEGWVNKSKIKVILSIFTRESDKYVLSLPY